MSRTPLALKYRPRTFSDVVGQEHVTDTLRNALRTGRVGAAYFFAGPRGSGKTTTARLLARAVNCTALREGEPCGESELCRVILGGQSLDVMEIDAASNRGIEDVRELRERVGYAAAQGEKKIYIVDEVHMLSKDAFNALLKTIEEPPPHVVFVFATTDPQKVLPTVLSRCQRFDFKRIPLREIEARLRGICDEEGQAITPEATFLLAKKADGSLRDAISMLDQVLSSTAGEVGAQAVRDVLGLASLELYLAATDAMRRRDPAAAIRFVRRLVADGVDLLDFYGGLYDHLRNLLLFALPGGEESAEVPDDFRAAYRDVAAAIGAEDLLRATALLTEHEFAFRGTSHPESMLEFLLLRMALLDRTTDVAALLDEVRSGAPAAAAAAAAPQSAPSAGTTEMAAAPRAASARLEDAWEAVLDGVSRQKPVLGGMLAQLERPSMRDDRLVLLVPGEQGFVADSLRDPRNRRLVEDVWASAWSGPPLRLEVSQGAAPAAEPAAFRRLDCNDPLVRRALDVFDADLVN
ncbi:MAG: DNA polymerase III subunit gamma/tau [Gemmatimonadota bacterium]